MSDNGSMTEKMKPIVGKGFFFLHQTLFWSEAYQSLPKSAINLMMCFYAELRWSGKGKKKVYTNNGEISFSEAEFKANKLGASQTYINARNQLIREIYKGDLSWRNGKG